MEQLSGIDDFWLRIERPDNLLTITALVWFEGQLTEQALKAKFGDDLLRFHRFRQKVVLHGPIFAQASWEDDPIFSMNRHVSTCSLKAGDEAALKELLDRLMSTPLPRDRPMWDARLVNGVRPGSTAMIIRVHHCLADGFSLIRLMLGLIDADCEVQLPGGTPVPTLSPNLEPEEGGGTLLAAREFAEKLMSSGLRVLRNPVPETGPLREVAQCATHLLTMPADAKTGLRGKLGNKKQTSWSSRISLEGVKRAAHTYGGTVNDLLLGVLAGAFRRYLLQRGEQVKAKELRAMVPVNVRPMEQRTDELGNGFGLVFIYLPVGAETLAERLEILKQRMDALKRSPEAFVTFGLMQAVGLLPAVLQEQMTKLFEGKATAVVTNMPGPVNPVRIAGHIVQDMVFFVPQSAGSGVGISIFSYAGFVRVGVAADARLVPEPDQLIAAYNKELRQLGLDL